MAEEPQLPLQRKPKSLLETHQDAHVLIKALNEYAATQQKPSPTSAAHGSEVPTAKEPVEGSAVPVPVHRKRAVRSEQPSVSRLLELGVKVRDFAYESTLPPVPTVYRQPRQIQPSEPKDENDPNDPHYILEEERKKRVYTLHSTRKIERTPTEPVLEIEQGPPQRPTFPKIKRDHALLDINSQPQYSTPSSSQAVPPLAVDSQQTEPWVDTPIVTPNGSQQWLVADTSAVPASQLDSDSQAPPAPEPMSYSQMGFSQPPQFLVRGSGIETPRSLHQTPAGRSPNAGPSAQGSPERGSPLNPRRLGVPSLLHAEQIEPPTQQGTRSPATSALAPQQQERLPSPSPSPAAPTATSPSPSPPHLRYNLRSKRPATSPPASPVPPALRPRLAHISENPSGEAPVTVSAKSAHSQSRATGSALALSSRPLKREGDESSSASIETRRSKRRSHS